MIVFVESRERVCTGEVCSQILSGNGSGFL